MNCHHPETETYLRNIDNILSCPENIEPEQLAAYIAAHQYLAVNDHVSSLLSRHFFSNISHWDAIRYLRLVDRFVSMGCQLPRAFSQMFVECCQGCFGRGQMEKLEELKVMRKLWTPILQERLISELKLEVYKRIGIDLDQINGENSRRYLRKHFRERCGFSEEQITSILN